MKERSGVKNFGRLRGARAPAKRLHKKDLVFRRILTRLSGVWTAWTDAKMVKQWWGPEGFTCPLARMDIREGGRSCLHARAKRVWGQDIRTLTYTKIVPLREIEPCTISPTRMATGWIQPSVCPRDAGRSAQSRGVQAAGDNKTEVTVTEFGWPAGQMRQMSRAGMEQVPSIKWRQV
jgi:uncharacterized protein YndB with AHSA1/START domain